MYVIYISIHIWIYIHGHPTVRIALDRLKCSPGGLMIFTISVNPRYGPLLVGKPRRDTATWCHNIRHQKAIRPQCSNHHAQCLTIRDDTVCSLFILRGKNQQQHATTTRTAAARFLQVTIAVHIEVLENREEHVVLLCLEVPEMI